MFVLKTKNEESYLAIDMDAGGVAYVTKHLFCAKYFLNFEEAKHFNKLVKANGDGEYVVAQVKVEEIS